MCSLRSESVELLFRVLGLHCKGGLTTSILQENRRILPQILPRLFNTASRDV